MSEQLDVDSPFQADARTMVALVLTIVVGAVATASGVGGGAIYIPLFNALIGFALKPSTALSQACITMGSLAALFANFPRTSPFDRNAPLIDIPLMVMLTPMMLVGVGLGVVLNVMLPSWLLNILLLLLLLLLLVQAFMKGRGLWKAESKKKAEAAAAAAEGGDGDSPGDDGRSLQGLLPPDAASSHQLPVAGLTSASLRHRRGLPYSVSGPRGGVGGLDPDEDTSLGCLEGVSNDVEAAAASTTAGLAPERLLPATASATVQATPPQPRRGGGGSISRRTYADASLDCMEGVAPEALVAPESVEAEEEDGGVAPLSVARRRGSPAPGAGMVSPRTPAGVLARKRSSMSQLAPAPSWRAFNELGFTDFDTSGNEASEADDDPRVGRRPGTLPSSTRSPFSLPVSSGRGGNRGSSLSTARLFSQLLSRRPLASGAGADSRGTAPFLERRASYDPTTAGAAAAAAAGLGAGGEQLQDSWLSRRSKWRSRFLPAALPHRGPPLPGGGPSGSLDPAGSPLLIPSAIVTPSPSQRPSSRNASGSGWLPTRLSHPRSGHGFEVERERRAFEEPLLVPGPHEDGSSHQQSQPPAGPSPDPTAPWYGGGTAAAPAAAPSEAFLPQGSGDPEDAEAYWQPHPNHQHQLLQPHLETLLEEREYDTSATSPPVAATAAMAASAAASAAGTSAWDARSPFAAAAAAATSAAGGVAAPDVVAAAAAAVAVAVTGGEGSLHRRSPPVVVTFAVTPSDGGKSVRTAPAPYGDMFAAPQQQHLPVSSAAEASHQYTPGAMTPFEVEDYEPYDMYGQYGQLGRCVAVADAAAAGVVAWAQRWVAAGRRVPKSYAAVLIATWALYLALQAVRAYQPKCDSVWWVVFVLQIVVMVVISLMAVRSARRALAAAAAAASASASVEEGRASGSGGGAARIYQPPSAPSPPSDDGGAASNSGDDAKQQGDGFSGSGNSVEDGAASRDQKRWSAPAAPPAAATITGPLGAGAASAPPPTPPGTSAAAAGAGGGYHSESASLLVVRAPAATLSATFGAGLTGGLLGLGGGMVMGPLLLYLGVHPQVTAATSGAMVLFSSSAALIQFALLHKLNLPYALVFGLASMVAGLVGTHVVAKAVKASGRPSIVVLALAGVMAAGTLSVAVFGMREAAQQLAAGDLDFQGICGSGS